MNELGLGVVFSAKSLGEGVMRQVTTDLLNVAGASTEAGQAIKSSFQQFSTGLAVFGAGATTLAGAMKLADISGEFSAAIAAVGAVSGASVADLKRLEEAALDAGVATQFNPKEAAVGLGDLAQQGYSAAESMALLNPVLDLAAGSLGELSPSGAAGLASQTLKAFKIPIGEAAITMDRLLQSVNAFALSAGELPLALGTAARGAGVMNQSLSETLIALGLVKNVIPGVERASTAVAVAMERMVDPATQTALKGLGVNVTTVDGKFRPFLDIIQELMPALAGMGSESKQSAFLLKTFGTEGLGGIQALLAQLSGGLKTSTGEMVKGAAAVDYLRGSFEGAKGTAQDFAGALNKTYEGQKKILSGSMETLAIVMGKPFEAALRPIVTIFADAVNGVIKAVRSLPTPVTDFIAKAVLFAGTVMTVVGGMLAFKASIGLVSAGLSAIGVTASSFVATLWPVVAVLGIAVAGFYAFKAAYEENLGGFGDFARDMYKTVSLAFRALGQLFSQGGFSGAVLEELEAGHDGVEAFAINVYLAFNRVRNFFTSLVDAFYDGIARLKPTLIAFETAIDGVAVAFFGLVKGHDEAQSAFDSFGRAGKKTGDILVSIANIVIGAATAALKLATELKPLVDIAGALFDKLGGVEGIAKLVEIALVALAAQKIAGIGLIFAEIGAQAVVAAVGLGQVLAAALATKAFKWAELASTIQGAMSGLNSSLASKLGPVNALALAITALYLAYTQWLELEKQMANDGGTAWNKFKRDITGHWSDDGSDDSYNRSMGIRIGDGSDSQGMASGPGTLTYDQQQAQRHAEIMNQIGMRGGYQSADPALASGPRAAYDAPVASTVIAASMGQGSSGDTLATAADGLMASAQSLQAAHEGTTIIRATLKMDSREVGEMISEAQRSSSSDNQVPVSLIP